MVDADDIGTKSIERVAEIATAAGHDIEGFSDDPKPDQQETVDVGDTDDDVDYNPELGPRWINQIRDREGGIIPNDYDTGTLELIIPRRVDSEAKELVQSWRGGSDHDVRKLSPSFDDDPDIEDRVIDSLTAIQFYTDDPSKVQNVGYDLDSIVEVLENDGIPFLWTRAAQFEEDPPA